jgi:lipoprotein signal peptidase
MAESRRTAGQRLLWFFALAIICLTGDLITKNHFAGTLPSEQRTPAVFAELVIIPHYLSFVYNNPVNNGALFSLGTSFGVKANTFFLAVSAIAVIVILGWALWPGIERTRLMMFSLAIILSGAAGNLHDRIVYGGVRDWIFVYYMRLAPDGMREYPFTWPIFNLADCFLIAGAALLVLQGLVTPDPKKSESTANTLAPAAT